MRLLLLSFFSSEMPALKRRPKRSHPEDMSDDGSDNENGILAQRAARRKAAQLHAIDEANVSLMSLCAYQIYSLHLQQTNNDRGGGIPRRPLSPPPSSPGIRPPNDIDESRESPLNDLTPSPGPRSDNGRGQSPSPGPPPANPAPSSCKPGNWTPSTHPAVQCNPKRLSYCACARNTTSQPSWSIGSA